MNVKVENIEKNVVQLEIEVDSEKFEEGLKKSYKKNVGKFSVPGFRKGKVPRSILERNYGKEVLYEDAINFVCPDAYDDAIEQEGLHPVERPEIDIKQIGNNEPFIFTAKVTTKPDVELGEYKGIEIEKIEALVSDEDVDAEIKKTAEQNSRIVTVEDRPIKVGDTAIIDFEGFVDGEAFEGGKGENHSLEIGSGQFIPGFEEQLIGVNKDDDVEVKVTFPEEYHSKDLAGKESSFKVKIHEIKEKVLPVLDDEFAKDISEFDTLDEYKASVKESLLESKTKEAKYDTEEKLIEKIVANATTDIPKVMISNHVDSLVYDFEMNLKMQGLNLEQYLNILNMNTVTFRQRFEERADKEVRNNLVIEKICVTEDIQSSDEDFETELKELSETYNRDLETLKSEISKVQKDRICESIKMKKTVAMLVENAKLV
jgi:trigger factor